MEEEEDCNFPRGAGEPVSARTIDMFFSIFVKNASTSITPCKFSHGLFLFHRPDMSRVVWDSSVGADSATEQIFCPLLIDVGDCSHTKVWHLAVLDRILGEVMVLNPHRGGTSTTTTAPWCDTELVKSQ